MKRLLVPMAVLAAVMMATGTLQGCARSDSARHAGTWELDNQVVKDAMMAEIEAIEDPEEKQAMEMGMSMMGAGMLDAMNMTLTLNEDGTASSTTSMMGQSETVTGRWSADGNSLTIEMEDEGQTEAVTARVDGDSLELLPPEGEEMPFRLIMKKRQN